MIRSYLAFVAVLAIAPVAAVAADLPKAGADTYTTAFVLNVFNTLKGADRSVSVYEVRGISHNESGGAMFNNMTTVCEGMSETVGGSTINRGTCIDADKDGDQIASTYEAKDGTGSHTYVGGTGKYSGMSGTAPFTSQPMRGADGKFMNLVTHKATWKLP